MEIHRILWWRRTLPHKGHFPFESKLHPFYLLFVYPVPSRAQQAMSAPDSSDAINSLPRKISLKSSLNVASFPPVPSLCPPREGRADFYIYKDKRQCLKLSNPFLLIFLCSPHLQGFCLSCLLSKWCLADPNLPWITVPQIG